MTAPASPDALTLGDLLIRATSLWPDRDAIIFPDRRLTYAQLHEGALKIARGLRALGLGRGQHIGLFMGNGPDYVEAFFGIALLGGVAVPLNTRHRASELAYIIAKADLAALLTSGRDTDYNDLPGLLVEALCEGGALQPEGPHGVSAATAPRLRHIIDLGGDSARPGFLGRDAFDALGAPVAPKEIEYLYGSVQLRDPALILFTSGTTAHPKGCVLSHEAATRGAGERARNRFSVAPARNVTWSGGPLFHIGSLAPFLGSVGVAGTFLSDSYFEAGRAIALMKAEGVTLAWPLFSPLALAVIDHPDFDPADFGSLQFFMTVGPEAVLERLADLFPGVELLQACGMTETAGIFAVTALEEDRHSRSTTQGRASPDIELRVVDQETGQDCAPGQMGELWVRGYCVMDGYYGEPEQTSATLTDDGWLKTGDLYSRSPSGSMIFEGRLKDLIKVGGENVGTMELEVFLCSHPEVKRAEVVGRPDDRLDEVAVAFVELREGGVLMAEELIAFCRGKIASYKVPRAIFFMAEEEWPMSATKVDKRALRARLQPEPRRVAILNTGADE